MKVFKWFLINFSLFSIRPIKYYPYEERFEFLYFDHSAEGCKYGNAQVEVFLGHLPFIKGAKKNFTLLASSEEIDQFYDGDLQAFRFPFEISYNVCCYRSTKDEEDFEDVEEVNGDGEAAEEAAEDAFEFVNQSDKSDESAITITANPDQEVMEYLVEPSFDANETDQTEPDADQIEPEDSLIVPDMEAREMKVLSPESRKVIQTLLKMPECFANIIIDHFKDYSAEEMKTVVKEVAVGLNIETFFEVLDCADFWDCNELKTLVTDGFMSSYDTKILINSAGFKKLKSNPNLLEMAKQLISDAFINKRINSPIIFFL